MNDGSVYASSIGRALQWIVDYLDEFSPFEPGEAFQYDDGKKVAELAVMLFCYSQHTGDRNGEQVREIIAFLQTIQANKNFADSLLRSPVSFVLHCDLYYVLRSLGYDDPDRRSQLQRALDVGLVDQYERSPYRLMDVRVSVDLGELQSSLPSVDEVYRSTSIAKSPNPLYMDEAALYVLTHVIMYLYYYGIRSDTPANVHKDHLHPTLANLLVSVCQEKQWDLLGELLLCWDCMSLPEEPVYLKAWEAFLAVQAQDGSFRGPRVRTMHRADGTASPYKSEREAYFYSHYHTTVVGIVACSLHLARERKSSIAGPTLTPSSADMISAPQPETPGAGSDLTVISGAIERAREWLHQLLQSGVSEADDGAHSTRSFLYLLFGIWVCDSALDKDDSEVHSAARLVWEKLVDSEADALYEALSDIPPTLTLAAAAVLSSQGLEVPALQQFLQGVASVLEGTSDEDDLTGLLLCEKRVLLHKLGLLPSPRLAALGELAAFSQALTLTASLSEIEMLLLYANSCAGYGIRGVKLSQDESWIGDLLSGLAVHFLREYDLIMGCRLMRAMSYLGLGSHPGLKSCVEFLCLHQRPEGAFGLFGPEEVRLHAKLPGFNEELGLYLPATVSCLLALAEASPVGWRLFGALGRLNSTTRDPT